MAEQGTVKWYNDAKGYGFITPDTGIDVFVHKSRLVKGEFMALQEGDRVTFDIIDSPKGREAINVMRIPFEE
jgi:cold shock protein